MNHEGEAGKITFFTLIAGRKQKDALLYALCGQGARLVHVLYGRGSVQASYLEDVLGLVPEEHKVVITCVVKNAQADTVLQMLVEKFAFDKPNTGIAFTIPIDKLVY